MQCTDKSGLVFPCPYSWHVYGFPTAAVTSYYKPGGLPQRIFIPCRLGGQECDISLTCLRPGAGRTSLAPGDSRGGVAFWLVEQHGPLLARGPFLHLQTRSIAYCFSCHMASSYKNTWVVQNDRAFSRPLIERLSAKSLLPNKETFTGSRK